MLTGLAAGTVYHARIVISSTAGTDPGDDVAFTTLGIPAPRRRGGHDDRRHDHDGGTTTTAVKKKAKKRQCIVPKVTGKKLNKARTSVYAKGCKVQVKYVKSKKAKNTVLAQSRKAGKKLGFRAVVKLTVARRRGEDREEVLSLTSEVRAKGPAACERPGPSHARPRIALRAGSSVGRAGDF